MDGLILWFLNRIMIGVTHREGEKYNVGFLYGRVYTDFTKMTTFFAPIIVAPMMRWILSWWCEYAYSHEVTPLESESYRKMKAAEKDLDAFQSVGMTTKPNGNGDMIRSPLLSEILSDAGKDAKAAMWYAMKKDFSAKIQP